MIKAFVLLSLLLLLGCAGERPSQPKDGASSESDNGVEKVRRPGKNKKPRNSPPPGEPGELVHWQVLFEEIFQPKCIVCHNPDGQAPWIDLSNYEAFVANERLTEFDPENPGENLLVGIITDPEFPMPPAPAARLKEEEVNLIIRWFEAGLPE